MADELLKSIIKDLTLNKIKEDAINDLIILFKEGFEAIEKTKFPVYSRFTEIEDKVIERKGFIDAWLTLIFFCMFTQGISIGRKAEKIEKDDIVIAKNSMCDRSWPKCPVMRLYTFSNVLSDFIAWYGSASTSHIEREFKLEE